MLQSSGRRSQISRLVLTALVGVFVCGCGATVPDTAWVRDADLPDYKVGSHRVDEAVDVYIEPRIGNLRRSVTPRSEKKEFVPIPIVVGPALETALLSLTRQHFSKATPVKAPAARPTLSYKLLAYKPVVSVVPGFFSTQLNVSARLVIQVSINSSTGKQLFSTTAIGTSHVSDTEIAAGDGLNDGPRLLEVATRDAMIDALYDISSVFGNSSDAIHDDVHASEIDPGIAAESIDDVVLYLRTWHGD